MTPINRPPASAPRIWLKPPTIAAMKADWSLLTQPARLQRLVEAYSGELGLVPLEPTQIGTLAELPQRPLDIETLIGEDVGAMASARDAATTGSVRP